MLKAITRQARLVDSKVAAHNKNLKPGAHPLTVAGFFDHHATDEDTAVVVSEEDFDSARRELVPSVSYEELQHYERVRNTFEGAGKKDAPATVGNGKAQPRIAIEASAATPTNGLPPSSAPAAGGSTNDKASPAPKAETRRLSAAKLKGLREKTLNSLHRSRSRSEKGAANSSATPDSVSQASQDDSEDEYTIDTSHLANGNGKAVAPASTGAASGKGKASSGKGKGSFGEAADDEDLYI